MPASSDRVRRRAETGDVAVDPAEYFFGRNDEQRGLLARLDRGPAAIAVTGPPGIGKTRLLSETLGLAGQTRLSGSAWVGASGHRLLPWRQVASAAAALLDPFAGDFGERFRACSAIFPGALESWKREADDDSDVLLAVEFGDYLRRLAHASDGPIAVVIDNLHHADQASLELLGRLVDQRLPVSFVVAVRRCAGDGPTPAPLRACLDRFETLRLGSLGAVAVDDLLTACAVPVEQRQRAISETAGVPVLLQHWLSDECVDRDDRRTGAAAEARDVAATWVPDLAATGTFHRNGSLWTIGLGSESATIGHLKGLTAIASLIDCRGRELHVTQLSSVIDGCDAHASRDGQGELHAEGSGDLILDDQALSAYRAQISDLEAEVAEAREFNDLIRCARAEDDLAQLVDHLTRATGLGGRSRRTNTSVERARVRVTKSIRTAVARIFDVAPSLGRHLDASIHTGSYCSYRAIAPSSVTWSRS